MLYKNAGVLSRVKNKIKNKTGKIKDSLKKLKNGSEVDEALANELYSALQGNKKVTITGIFGPNKQLKDKENLVIVKNPTLKGLKSSYIPNTFNEGAAIINVPPKVNEAILAHEMAHSTSRFLNSKPGHALYLASKASTSFIPGIAISSLKKAKDKGVSPEKLEKMRKFYNRAALVSASPVLYEETRANLKALKALKNTGKLNLRTALPLAVSEASYLAGPMMTKLVTRLK